MNSYERSRSRGKSGCGGRLIGAVILAIVAWVAYQSSQQANPVTGEMQHVTMTTQEEIALGLQAAPSMAQQFGGVVTSGQEAQVVDQVGQMLVAKSDAANSPYQFDFHLLADDQTVNAFALPGGQVFITRGLLSRLSSIDQLAGVLGHEIGHVIERHGSEHLAKQQFTQGLTAAAAVAMYDPENPNSSAGAAMAQMVGQLVNLKYGRNDEMESDEWGIEILVDAGYNPYAMAEVMRILEKASGGAGQPEILSSHPDPGKRAVRIEEIIKEKYPNIPTN